MMACFRAATFLTDGSTINARGKSALPGATRGPQHPRPSMDLALPAPSLGVNELADQSASAHTSTYPSLDRRHSRVGKAQCVAASKPDYG